MRSRLEILGQSANVIVGVAKPKKCPKAEDNQAAHGEEKHVNINDWPVMVQF